MPQPMMPKATAVWLVENTSLTFEQIADFCGMHPLEVQGIADGEVAVGIVGLDPVTTGQLTSDEVAACEKDPRRRLRIAESDVPRPAPRTKGPRYTPVAKRQDRPNAIAWLLRYHPELTDGQVAKLVGTTKPTINGIRTKTHWNMSNIKPEDPVSLGMCSQMELDTAVTRAKMRERAREEREAARIAAKNAPKPVEAVQAAPEAEPEEAADDAPEDAGEDSGAYSGEDSGEDSGERPEAEDEIDDADAPPARQG